jgi:hypothetical protein
LGPTERQAEFKSRDPALSFWEPKERYIGRLQVVEFPCHLPMVFVHIVFEVAWSARIADCDSFGEAFEIPQGVILPPGAAGDAASEEYHRLRQRTTFWCDKKVDSHRLRRD